jgi:sec-independent protein translocase protein TatB
MSFAETIFLFLLALVIFGPKKLPEIARQAGRLLNEVKRASNEFKAQIEQEVNNLEREDARKALPPATPPAGAVVSRRLNEAPAASDATSDSMSSETILSDQSAPAAGSVPAATGQESHG